MSGICELKAANSVLGEPCGGGECPFWRVVGHLGAEEGAGCAIQHFALLGDDDLAAWLLSVKLRVEAAPAKTEGGA